MKNALYMEDSYLKEFEAVVESVNGGKYVILDKTAFYPRGGGQPHDTGIINCNGIDYNVAFTGKFEGKISHEVDKEGLKAGDKITGKISWERRYKLMRMHTAAHIIDAVLYTKANALCTGNQLECDKSRIDFSLEVIDKDKMQEYIDTANKCIETDAEVKIYSMPRDEALKIKGIVKLASAMPPEVNDLRIVEIPNIDLQADGGTHVKKLKEIGKINLASVENKGKNNRRLYFTLK